MVYAQRDPIQRVDLVFLPLAVNFIDILQLNQAHTESPFSAHRTAAGHPAAHAAGHSAAEIRHLSAAREAGLLLTLALAGGIPAARGRLLIAGEHLHPPAGRDD